VEIFKSPRHRRRAALALGAFAVGLGSLYLTAITHEQAVTELVRSLLDRSGILAPLVYIAGHTIQVVLMAIPGYVMAFAGGAFFGAFWGTVYTMIGVTLGSVIAFLIARRFGRSIVERMIDEEALDRFDTFAQEAGVPSLFVFVLVPVLPEDVISFVAGVAQFRLWVFALVMFVGRLPAAVLAVLAGDGFAQGQLVEGSVWLLALLAACAVTYYYRTPIMERIG